MGIYRFTGINRMPCDDGDRGWSEAIAKGGMPKIDNHHQKLRRGKKRFSPTCFRIRMALLTPKFKLLAFITVMLNHTI